MPRVIKLFDHRFHMRLRPFGQLMFNFLCTFSWTLVKIGLFQSKTNQTCPEWFS